MAAKPAMGLGVTALLDELLAKEAEEAGPAVVPEKVAAVPAEAQAANTDPSCVEGTKESEGAVGGDDASYEPNEVEQEAEAEVSRQVAELCGEVDACLESMANWEEESRQRREALKRELEAQYGFSYEDSMLDGPRVEAESGLEEDEEENEEMNVSAYIRGAEPLVASMMDPPMAQRAVPAAHYRALDGQDEAMRLADEARIERLRAEVEKLRRRGAQGEAAQEEVSGTDLDSSCMREWCAEVDAALGMPMDDSLDMSYYGGPGDMESGMEIIDNRLASAMEHGRDIEGALNVANMRIEAELGDLDRLLSECDAIQAKMDQATLQASY